MATALGMEEFLIAEQRAELNAQMDEEAVAAGYGRGYLIQRVLSDGERISIVASTGEDGGTPIYFLTPDDSHQHALVASLEAAQRALDAGNDADCDSEDASGES